MSTTSQFFSGGTSIKSIQRGTITVASATSATATITSVDTAKSELRMLGETMSTAASIGALATNFVRISLTNATTITATRISAAADATIVSWELTEWN